MEVEVMRWIAAGGDVATMGVLYALWRLDRRIVVLELFKDRAAREDTLALLDQITQTRGGG